jgi:TetR/AcrR family transcriptional regulator, transcriptional repressor for nem operon
MARTKEFDPEVAIDLALDLFWKRGYEGTSLRELLDAMDISRQSLYDTFGDKRSLFIKVLGRYEKLAMEGLVQHLEGKSSVLAVRGFGEYFMANVVRDRGSCLMASTAIEVGDADAEIQSIVRAYFARVETAIHSVLAGAMEAGQIAEDRDLRALARHLVNAIHGLGVMSRAGASRPMLRQMLNVALSVLER